MITMFPSTEIPLVLGPLPTTANDRRVHRGRCETLRGLWVYHCRVVLMKRWHTQHVKDGDHDVDAMEAAIEAAKAVKDKPSLIKLTTTIGFGSKLQGTGGVHGNPLKADDAKEVKKKLSLSPCVLGINA